MNRTLRIGTRDSKLATWQAEEVMARLEKQGLTGELVLVKTEGDLDLTTPLSEMGGKGVFTKALDEALLRDEIDLAVHSLKDLPTLYPLPLKVAAVLERGDSRDALVAPGGSRFLEDATQTAVIATGSNRRRAQWLHRFPGHRMVNIRGNVQTRLQKVEVENHDGAIFAAAGLHRTGLEHHICDYLDWMVPAPGQGAVAVMIREGDSALEKQIHRINHPETELCTGVERELLTRLEAGCSAPLGAYAWLEDEMLHLYAVVLTLDGSLQYDVEISVRSDEAAGIGLRAAEQLLDKGAEGIVEDLRKKS